jgi:hypothetical protein
MTIDCNPIYHPHPDKIASESTIVSCIRGKSYPCAQLVAKHPDGQTQSLENDFGLAKLLFRRTRPASTESPILHMLSGMLLG